MRSVSGMIAAGALALAAGSASAQSAVGVGQSVAGALEAGDRTLDDDSHYDCYRLEARAGESVTVTLRAGSFDAYLAIIEGRDCQGAVVESDDDGAGGTDSQLDFTVGQGRYLIRANSLSGGETGSYTLSVARGIGAQAPTTVGGAMSLPGDGERLDGELTAGDALAADESLYDCYAFDSGAGQLVMVGMMSDDFDAYLSLHDGGTCDGEALATDDDSFAEGATHALIEGVIETSGRYSVRANSLGSGETGRYSIAMFLE